MQVSEQQIRKAIRSILLETNMQDELHNAVQEVDDTEYPAVHVMKKLIAQHLRATKPNFRHYRPTDDVQVAKDYDKFVRGTMRDLKYRR
jgi:hypothetical protein